MSRLTLYCMCWRLLWCLGRPAKPLNLKLRGCVFSHDSFVNMFKIQLGPALFSVGFKKKIRFLQHGFQPLLSLEMAGCVFDAVTIVCHSSADTTSFRKPPQCHNCSDIPLPLCQEVIAVEATKCPRLLTSSTWHSYLSRSGSWSSRFCSEMKSLGRLRSSASGQQTAQNPFLFSKNILIDIRLLKEIWLI